MIRTIADLNDNNHWKIFISSLKKDKVFTVSLFLALVSSIFSIPRLSYINFKVIILMFNLMIVICVFKRLKLLEKIAVVILSKHKSQRMISLMLIALSFISSMLITNDVALITFVPITLIIAKKAQFNPMRIIILQTLAANIGSSFTPMGNPQNLFLFSFYNIRAINFFKITILFVVMGAVWLTILNCRNSNKNLQLDLRIITIDNKKKLTVYVGLFILTILSIFNIIDYRLVFIITLIVGFISDKGVFKEVDYILLLTFISFFIFIGNLSSMPFITEFMRRFLLSPRRVYFASIFLSQFISNVPNTILLSEFTRHWKEILIGVNIGGMGTLIASLASVISYKFYSKEYNGKKYLLKFHLYNFLSLLIFTGLFYMFM